MSKTQEHDDIRVLVTGCAGFIGAHLVDALLHQTQWEVIGLDSFRGKGTYTRLNDIPDIESYLLGVDGLTRFRVFHHDLTAPIDSILAKRIGPIDVIFNLASSSAVEQSIKNPIHCWRNNCELMINVLEYAREQIGLLSFVHVSTDEVYGSYPLSSGKGFAEWATVNPSNPYAASKAAQEALVIAYWRTYDLPVMIINTMNNIGEWQENTKFVPKVIGSLIQGEKIRVYTDDQGFIGSRAYLDVKDHARFLIALAKQPPHRCSGNYSYPHRWHVAGKEQLSNLEMVKLIASVMEISLPEEQLQIVKAESNRPGYGKRHLLDNGKLTQFIEKQKIPSFTPLPDTLKRIIQHVKEKSWWL